MTGDSVSPSDGQTPSAVETAVRRALRIPGVRVDRERFLLKQASGLCPDDGARRRVLSEGIAAMLTEPELRALGLRRVLQLTAWSSSAAVAAALPGGPIAMTAGAGADVMQQLAFGLRLSQELAYLYGHRLSAGDHEGGPLSDQELEQLLLLFGTLLEVEGAAAAVRLTGPRLERDGRPVGYGHESTGSAGAGLPADLLRRSFAGPISHRVLARVASRMGSTVLRRGTLRAVPLLGAIGAGGTAFSTLQAQGRILNHELAEGLDYTAGKVMADVETLRRALGTG
ncbi:hypothetical protein ACL90Y_03475 [Micrococcus luteus]